MKDEVEPVKTTALIEKFYIRFHTFIIVATTALMSLIASHVMLRSGWNDPALRYPLAALISYLYFVFATRMWLHFMANHIRENPLKASSLDLPDRVPVPESEKKTGVGDLAADLGFDVAEGAFTSEAFAAIAGVLIFVVTLAMSISFFIEMPVLLADLLIQGALTSSLVICF